MQGYSGRYEKSSNSESTSRHSGAGAKTAFDDNKYSGGKNGGAAQNYRNNGFKQMRSQMCNRSSESQQQAYLHRDRRGSLGMDSCDYNSNSSGYFDEHAEYENQQQAVYEFQQNTS